MKDYPFTKFALLFVIGIIAEKYFQIDSISLIIIIASLILLLVIFQKLFRIKILQLLSTVFVYAIILFTGCFIASTGNEKINSPLVKYQKEKSAKLFAKVVEIELEKSFEIVFTVKTDSILFDNKLFITRDKLICKFRGDTLQRKHFYEKINPGNKIYLTGTFQKGRDRRNPGEFDYDQYLKSKGITGLFIAYDTDSLKIVSAEKDYFQSALFSVRKNIDRTIHDLHDSQTAGLLRGLLLADRSEIDFETKSEFINSGVIHILAVSGLHVGYVLIIFVFLFGRFNIYTRSMLTILGLIFFMFITGVPPSVFRATLMAITIISAFLFNRSTNVINSISIAAVIILLFNPNEIYNPGFQLSFAAVLSIGIIYPYFQRSITKLNLKQKWIEYILLFFGVSLSAQIGTIPFTLAYFSKLSLIALFANLIVIPVVGIIIGIAFMAIIIGGVSYGVAINFGAANNLISRWMIDFIKFTGSLDYSFLWIRNYSLYDAIVFYTTLIVSILFFKKVSRPNHKFAIFIIAIFIIIFFSRLDNKQLLEDNKLSVLMIDVGQGDSFLIKFPNGKTALIDAGEANQYLDNGDRIILPLLDYLGINKIDYGFVSHLDLDHYGGFVSLIFNDRIKEVYRPLPDSSDKSIRFEKFLADKKIKTNIYSRSHLDIGTAKIYFLNDPNDYIYKSFSSNDKSGILKIVYGKTSFLFVGDCEFPGEYYLASNFREMLDSDVLKVGHHGSKTGSSKLFLNLVSPKISLVSVGIKNKFDHPSADVINSLESIHSKIYRTDFMGAVLLKSDGKQINFIDWKNN